MRTTLALPYAILCLFLVAFAGKRPWKPAPTFLCIFIKLSTIPMRNTLWCFLMFPTSRNCYSTIGMDVTTGRKWKGVLVKIKHVFGLCRTELDTNCTAWCAANLQISRSTCTIYKNNSSQMVKYRH